MYVLIIRTPVTSSADTPSLNKLQLQFSHVMFDCRQRHRGFVFVDEAEYSTRAGIRCERKGPVEVLSPSLSHTHTQCGNRLTSLIQ
jgi:hypothetical protein